MFFYSAMIRFIKHNKRGVKMTYQTVTFKDKKYNIDDPKTAKNLTQMQEVEIKKLNILINDYKHLLEGKEKLENKIKHLEELDRKNFLQLIKLQNKITDYETNFIEYYKYEELQNDYLNLVQVLNNKKRGVK